VRVSFSRSSLLRAALFLCGAIGVFGATPAIGLCADSAGTLHGFDTTFSDYLFIAVVLFALPLAILVCGILTGLGRSRAVRILGIVLLIIGAGVLVGQVLRTGVGDLMLQFAAPLLVAAALVYSLAAIALLHSPSSEGRGLASTKAASGLLMAAALIQFAGPWMLVSGQ